MATLGSDSTLTGSPTLTGMDKALILRTLDEICRTTLKTKKSLQKMLVFIVTKTLEHHAESLKEYSIATLVFGKRESFDPRLSSLVRTQACKLRRALIDHYSAYQNATGPWIWVPPGSYHPIFDINPAMRAVAEPVANAVQPPASSGLPRIAPPTTLSQGSDLRSIAEGVVRMQQEHLVWREGIERLADKIGGREPERVSAMFGGGEDPTIEQTVVELDGRLLLTMCLTAGIARSIIYAHSLSVTWNGNVDSALAEVGPHVSDFASSCLSLVRPNASSPFVETLPIPSNPLFEAIRKREPDSVPNG